MIRFLHPAGLNVRKRVGEEREGLYNFLVVVYIYIYISFYFYFIFITNRREHKSLLRNLDEVSQIYIYIYI